MFFVLAKILGFFALPSNLVISVGLLGAVLVLTRYARFGMRLVLASLVLLAVLGLSPLGNALILPLENRFPPWQEQGGPPDGIVVLGGAFDTLVGPARDEISLNESAERVAVVAELARRFPNARIVFSGGSGRLVFRGATEATLATRLFDSFGISRSRFASEDQSRDTYENAQFSKEIAQPDASERWLLVTSAHHMPRAIGVFRKAGFPVEAYPVDWRTRGRDDLWRPADSVGAGLRRVDTAVREYVGLLMYWLSGRTGELFPGP